MKPISIWVVEDDAGYRRMLHKLLNRKDGMACERVFSACPDLFEALESGVHPDLVLMDLGLPEMDGVEGIRRLTGIAPDLAVVVLTVFSEKEKVMEALDAGAVGYLLKSSTPQEVVHAIHEVFSGGAALSPEVAKIILEEMQKSKTSNTFDLTKREKEVLVLLAEDLPTKQIADKMGVSIHTVDFHLRNLYSKLQVQSQTGAVAKAFRSGIL